MKLTNYTLEDINASIRTLIEFNKIFGSPDKNTDLGFSVKILDKSIKITFFIDYYENQNNQQEWQEVTIVKENTFRKLISEAQDVIEQYNDVEGYDDEEHYNWVNDAKEN